MSQFFARFVFLGLLATVAVGCGSPEPKVMIDKQTATKLQAERDAEEAAIYAKEMEALKDPAVMKADPYYNN